MASTTSLSNFRNLEEYQRSVRQAGHRVYHHLSEAQKNELKKILRDEMNKSNVSASSSNNNHSWTSTLEQTAQELIRAKNEKGDVIDANALVEEVLPVAHASIPAAVRQKLFATIFEMTNATAVIGTVGDKHEATRFTAD
jgi:CCR4-NOT transcriptional regulation complex NOT5 subunit